MTITMKIFSQSSSEHCYTGFLRKYFHDTFLEKYFNVYKCICYALLLFRTDLMFCKVFKKKKKIIIKIQKLHLELGNKP